MKEIEFNVNQCVKVRLTAHGRWLLRDWDGDTTFGMPNVDEVGRLEVRMCEVMGIFGKRMSKGLPTVFDTNMVLCLSCPEGRLGMKEVNFNVNQCVKVKLTERGYLILCTFLMGLWVYNAPEEDNQGYVKIQMCDFMRIFGEYMSLGEEPVFDMNIILCMED
jgi:hypothetical protein